MTGGVALCYDLSIHSPIDPLPAPRPSGGGKGAGVPTPVILVVDDDAALADTLANLLGDEGYRVERATSEAAALALLTVHGPDAFALVLTDSFAQGTDPYRWLDQVRRLTTGAIVLCSGWPPTVYADHAAHGCAAVLAKPFDLEALLATVAAPAG